MHAIVNRRLNDELAQILEDYPDLTLSDLLIGIEAFRTQRGIKVEPGRHANQNGPPAPE